MARHDLLVSVPSGAVAEFNRAASRRAENAFAASDPPGSQLGSGGGTAHLLVEAWRSACPPRPVADPPSFDSWLQASRKLIIHGSGQSRRLPAYAAEGKPLIPLPAAPDERGQRPDQMLLDIQRQSYERIFGHAPQSYRLMVTCGDVHIVSQRWLPLFPEVDVLIVGLVASPEEAQRHGVMICPADAPGTLAAFLQKPPIELIRNLAESHAYYLDTGIWLMSERAVALLMRKCGWQEASGRFAAGKAGFYDLYASFGPSLGTGSPHENAQEVDPEVRALSSAVLPLANARFYHFGTNRSLLASVAQLQRPAARQRAFGHASLEHQTEPVIQNSTVRCRFTAENRHIWIENSSISPEWRFGERHVVTGAPDNDWTLKLESGDCLDFVPIDAESLCVRFYGFDDPSRGAVSDPATPWLSRPARDWFEGHGLDLAGAGLDPGTDIQEAKLFPVMRTPDLDAGFIAWLLAPRPDRTPHFQERWRTGARLSADDLLRRADVARITARRRHQLVTALSGMDRTAWLEACGRLDLAATARLCTEEAWPVAPQPSGTEEVCTLNAVHDRMFRSVLRLPAGARLPDSGERHAFDGLRQLIVNETALQRVSPSRNILDDQIIWGRSPVRLDLAGGWTDTPPYCFEHGGRVVNVAVDLNGQPPIQVFARVSEKPEIVVRSIDLGTEDRMTSYEDIIRMEGLGSGFGIARAALALAGLVPRFHAAGGYDSLAKQLDKEFGGGIEISMLAAVPKGSGLGTSSILAATLLGTLSELCGLYWDTNSLLTRTLALEQMLTSGGGWQDQAGGIIGGLKLLETEQGLTQRPVVRWLPDRFFSGEYANACTLLYYTGLTRVAHGILGEIVRNIFLNSADHLSILSDIGDNALHAADVIQRHDWDGLCEVVRRSWRLNQRLDRGTNTPAVQAILDRAGADVSAAKLLGAGGGGYMLMMARDAEAGQRIRQALTSDPPNPRARFVDVRVAERGFQLTRS